MAVNKKTEKTVTNSLALDIAIILNSFIHDMFTGVWVSSLFVTYIVFTEAAKYDLAASGTSFIASIVGRLWYISIISVFIIAVTGTIRGISFKQYGWTGEIAKDRKRLLWIKHILLAIVFTWGMYFQFTVFKKLSI